MFIEQINEFELREPGLPGRTCALQLIIISMTKQTGAPKAERGPGAGSNMTDF